MAKEVARSPVQSVFVYIVFTITTLVNLVALYLLRQRRGQPLKSRAPLWLGISLIMGQIQTGTNLLSMLGAVECHVHDVSVFLTYSGYIMCLIVRCWKLHFVFNINKSKVLKTDYKSWFQRNRLFVSERFLVPAFVGFNLFLCLLAFIFMATDSGHSWHSEYGACDTRWIPDQAVNTIIFLACVITLIIFSFLLHKVDDGFSISRELRLSVALNLGAWGIFFVLLFMGGSVFGDEGLMSPGWVVVLAQIISAAAAAYWPLYLSYTDLWLDNQTQLEPVSRPVSRKELVDMYFFLNTPSGIEPFLRFLHAEFSAELLFLWRDIDEFTKEVDQMERKIKAKTIMEEYLDPEGNKYMPESEHLRANLTPMLEEAEFPANMFQEVKVEVEKRLRSKFSRFLVSHCYQQYACGVTMKESLMELGWQS